MKKFLMTISLVLAICGSMFAQYESHWDFNPDPFEMQSGIVAAIMIDGQIITAEYDNWDALEVAAFVGEGDDEEVRGNNMYLYNGYVEEYGDDFPVLDGYPIYYMISSTGDAVHFKMYDHVGEIEYTSCTILYNDAEFEVLTGEDHLEGWDDPANPIFLNFTTGGIEKDIVPFTGDRDHYYLLASPVGEVSPRDVTNMTENEYDLYSFDQSGVDEEGNAKEWRNYKANAFTSLEPGKGYLYANGGDGVNDVVTLTFPGTAYTEETTVTLVKDDAAQYFAGWNLIGNPYNEEVTIDRPYYRMNEDGDAILSNSETGAINPMEGVFVIAEENGETVTFSTEPSGKVASVALNLTRGTSVVDRAIVRFDNGRELPKFQLKAGSTKLYIPRESKDYAVVVSDGNGEMPVSFKAEQDGVYTVNVTTEEVSFRYLHLIDNMTGDDVDLLATPSYTFEARTTDYTSRFRLVFVSEVAADSDTFAFFSNGSFVISNDGEAVLQVVDVNGRVLSSEQISGCVSKTINAAPGVYMLRLVNGDDMRVQKVVVK